MKIFVDTSAFYAAAIPEDSNHQAARKALEGLGQAQLVTSNYVALECASLLQKRFGFAPAKTFLVGTLEKLEIVWIDERLHRDAVSIWAKTQNRGLSLVDCTSFAAMRHAGIRRAAAFDAHFNAQGFEIAL